MADLDGDGYDDATGKVVLETEAPVIAPNWEDTFDQQFGMPGMDTSAAVAAGAPSNRPMFKDSEDPWVLRTPNTFSKEPVYGAAADERLQGDKKYTYEKMTPGMPSPLDVFQNEYAKNLESPGFESWLVTRGWAFGRDLITKDGRFNAGAGREFWNWLGAQVGNNPEVRKDLTPEEYADARYTTLGGDASFSAAGGDPAAVAEKQNPITTQTSVSRATMNPSAAEAAVDDLARGLLGRMASEKELNRYRKQINSFLSKNPTTSTSVRDATDPDNVKMSTNTKGGASEADAVNVLEMRMRRGSEGMAFNAGKMIEDALLGSGRGL